MTGGLVGVAGADRVYRIARKLDTWRWPDWAYAGPDGTFGNRWDDPHGTYRVLYACSERVGAFIETLARFRPAPHVIAGLAAIVGADDTRPAGLLPAGWRTERIIGQAGLGGLFVDIGTCQHHRRSLVPLWFQLTPIHAAASAEPHITTLRNLAPLARHACRCACPKSRC